MSLIAQDHIQAHNAVLQRHADTDYEYLGEQLARRYIDIATITEQVAAFGVAIPSWGSERAEPVLPASPERVNHAMYSTSSKTVR